MLLSFVNMLCVWSNKRNYTYLTNNSKHKPDLNVYQWLSHNCLMYSTKTAIKTFCQRKKENCIEN
jgi:hypothetical protein